MSNADRRSSAEVARLLEETQRLAGIGSWSWDVTSGAVEWSSETYRILGYDPGSVEPSFERVLETAHGPDNLVEFQRRTEAALAGEEPYDLVLPLKGADGEDRYVHAFGEVERQEDGTPVRMFGFLHDVTEAHLRERALAESERRFRVLAESSPFGVFFAGPDGRATYANPQLLELYDLDHDAFCAGEWRARIVVDDVEGTLRDSSDAFTRQEGARLEYRIGVRGETRHVRVTTRPRRGESGEYLGQVGVVEDITSEVLAATERDELEAQLRHAQQLDSLGVLAGGIAHDFNNLLVGVLANAEMALMDLEPGHPARASVEDIETTAERAADLTRQLLAYAGRWPVAVESVDLAHLVEEMAQLLRAAVSRRAHLEVSCEPDTPRVTGDATQLRQIVMNLIRNAGDALEQGAGTIRVRANGRSTPPSPAEGRVFGEPLTDGIRYACVEVQDTGIGMSPETLGRIFDPFFSEKASGRGLGLATSLRIVRSHGGSIHVRTAPGRGSTFTLLFPAEGAPPRDAAPEPASPTDLEGRGTILVVDDEAGVRDVAAQLLRRAGFEVRTAANGREALDVLRGQRSAIRALVLDLTMPVMGGEATLREIRADDPDLPVVLMSGFADTEVGALLGGDRATAFVDKPFRGPVLREALARVLEATGR